MYDVFNTYSDFSRQDLTSDSDDYSWAPRCES